MITDLQAGLVGVSDADDPTEADASGRGSTRRHFLATLPAITSFVAAERLDVVHSTANLADHLGLSLGTPAGASAETTSGLGGSSLLGSAVSDGLSADLVAAKLTYGVRPGLVANIDALGPAQWIDTQLAADPRLVDGGLLGLPTLWADFPNCRNYGVTRCMRELDHATLYRAVHSESQLHEVMTDFWNDFFSVWRLARTKAKVGASGGYSYGFLHNGWVRDVTRRHALGSFTDMLQAASRHPMMLVYLDNQSSNANSADGVNLNYARELLELHTLGILDPLGITDVGEVTPFTENDVHGAARLMSGWTIRDHTRSDTASNRFATRFEPAWHSPDAVSMFGGRFTRPANRSASDAERDGPDLVSFLAKERSTALWVSYRLCRRFVSDTPSRDLVRRVADEFQRAGTAMAPTLRVLFTSPEFAGSRGAKVRRPVEQLVSTLRATDSTLSAWSWTSAATAVRMGATEIGERLHSWPTPDGRPDVNSYWLTSSGVLARATWAGRIANWWNGDYAPWGLTIRLNSAVPNPPPAAAADFVVAFASGLGNPFLTTAEAASLVTSLGIAGRTGTQIATSRANLAAIAALALAHPGALVR